MILELVYSHTNKQAYNETKLSNIVGRNIVVDNQCRLAWVLVIILVFTSWNIFQHALKAKIVCFEV